MRALATSLHFERKPPRAARPVCLSQLRQAFGARGLELGVDEGLVVRDGARVLHRPESLAAAAAWLDGAPG